MAARTSAEPAPRLRQSRSTSIARSPKPWWLGLIRISPATWSPATATKVPAGPAMPASKIAVSSSMSTGGSAAIPVRSAATAANNSAIARASSARAGLTSKSATGSCSHLLPGWAQGLPAGARRAAAYAEKRGTLGVVHGGGCVVLTGLLSVLALLADLWRGMEHVLLAPSNLSAVAVALLAGVVLAG